MKLDKMVWVGLEWSEEKGNHVSIIFKSRSAATYSEVEGKNLRQMLYRDAVKNVRNSIWLRSRGECEKCEAPVTESSGHMHEKKHRGKGGEISLDNSIFICARCHQYEHRERAPQWKKNLDKLK